MKGRWSARTALAWALLASCAGVMGSPEDEPQGGRAGRKRDGRISCFNKVYATAAKPTVCHTKDAIYVLGLPSQHGWRRGSRIVISQEEEDLGSRKVAVAWVVETLDRAAKVNVIFQRYNQSVEGGTATLHEDGDRLRFENYYARMASRSGKSITLDIGKDDGVEEGHTYEARKLTRPDYPVGLVRVTRVHDMHSDAIVVEEPEAFGAELHEFVLRRSTKPPAIAVAVAAIRREDAAPPSREGAKRDSREGLADKLRLAQKASPDVEVQVYDLRSMPGGDLETLLPRLAEGARARQASQVVWTGGPCAAEPCPAAYYADVPKDPKAALVPKPLLLPSMMGGGAADDASALVGQIAYAGKAFEEASYRLRTWAGSLHGDFSSEMLLQLVDAEVQLGQLGRARIWLEELERRYAHAAKPLSYYQARVRVACSNKNLWELRSLRGESRKRPELRKAQLDAVECAIELNIDNKSLAKARELLPDARSLASELGDQDALNRVLRWEAKLADQPGRLADRRKETVAESEEGLTAAEPQDQASQSFKLAMERSRSGDLNGALGYLERAFDLYKEVRSDAGLAECVPLFVGLWRSREGVEGARKRLSAERRTVKGPPWRRAELGMQIGGASLDLQAGKLARARKDLVKFLSFARKSQFVEEELQILALQVEQALIAGQMQQAQRALDKYKERVIDSPREADKARAHLLWARFELQDGKPKPAKEHADIAIRRYRNLDDDAGVAAGQLLLSDAHRELGDLEESRKHYEAAASAYEWLHDEEGRHLANVALFPSMGGGTGEASRDSLHASMTYFKKRGQLHEYLRAALRYEWAAFMTSRDHAAALRKLKALRVQAKNREFTVLRAEAQMLIACVHRDDHAYGPANREYQVARGLYGAMGRYEQPFNCPESRVSGPVADEGQDARP